MTISMAPLTFAVLAGATVASMTLHSVMGFGFAQFLAPVLLAVLSPPETVTALLAMAIVINVLVTVDARPAGATVARFAPLLPGAVLGLPLGVLVVTSVDKAALQVLSGLAIIGAVVITVTARRRTASAQPAGRAGAGIAGLLSGALTTAIGIGAPPAILWLESGRPPKEMMRWAIAAYSLVLCVVGVGLLVAGARDGALAGLVLAGLLLPCIAVGHACGRSLFRRIEPSHYRLGALALVTASGLAAIAAGAL